MLKNADINDLDPELVDALDECRQRFEEMGIQFSPDQGLAASQSEGEGGALPWTLKPNDPAAKRARSQADQNGERIRFESLSRSSLSQAKASRTPNATLFQAFDAYEKYLEKEYFDPEGNHLSAWGKTQIRQVRNLKKHHVDRLLTQLDADVVSELVGYWRRRPCKIGTQSPMTAKSSSNFVGTLVRFLKWLDKSSRHDWQKPFAFSDLDTRIRRLPSDHAKKSLEQVDTFSLDELRLLMRYPRICTVENPERIECPCGWHRTTASAPQHGQGNYLRHLGRRNRRGQPGRASQDVGTVPQDHPPFPGLDCSRQVGDQAHGDSCDCTAAGRSRGKSPRLGAKVPRFPLEDRHLQYFFQGERNAMGSRPGINV